MKVKLTKPLPQIGRVVPAGVILDNAPEALMEKLVRQGRAVWVVEEQKTQEAPNESPALPFTPRRTRRKKAGEAK